jgi:hypothetical protein
MDLLRQVPDIKFGPDVVTWPALVKSFSESSLTFEYQNEFHTMSAMTLESSEFGNLLNPRDPQMVDLFVSLWDGKTGSFEKHTKTSGNDSIVNPWINMIACTTPAWIAGNFPEYMIGGGFTSRCIFVYADKKAKYVAYPFMSVPKDFEAIRGKLVEDLIHISTKLAGPFVLSQEAQKWGMAWYEKHYANPHEHLDEARFGGYVARKQTHVHKLAMILAAAESDKLIIEPEHLAVADQMVTDLETDMQSVFSKIGKAPEAVYADRLVDYVSRRGKCPWPEAYRFVHGQFPNIQNFEGMITGLIRSEFLIVKAEGPVMVLYPGPAAKILERD